MTHQHGLHIKDVSYIAEVQGNNPSQYSLSVYVNNTYFAGKPQKKVPPLTARPLRGEGGGEAGPLRKKITFFETFFYFVAIKNKNYFTLDIMLHK